MNSPASKSVAEILAELERSTKQLIARRKTSGLDQLNSLLSESFAAEKPGPPVIELPAALLIAEYKALLAEERGRKGSAKVAGSQAVKPKRKRKERPNLVKEGLSFDFAMNFIILPDKSRIQVSLYYRPVLKYLLQMRKKYPEGLAVITLEEVARYYFEGKRLRENPKEDDLERATTVNALVNALTPKGLKNRAKQYRRTLGNWLRGRGIDPDAVLIFNRTEERYELGLGWKSGPKFLKNHAEKSLVNGTPDDESSD